MTEIMTESTQSNQSTKILDADSAWGTGGHTKTAEFVSAEQDLNSICQTACERRAGSPVVVHQALGRAVRPHSPRTPFRDNDNHQGRLNAMEQRGGAYLLETSNLWTSPASLRVDPSAGVSPRG